MPDNLKDFAVMWVLFGLLFFALITFATTFMVHNNPEGLGENKDRFDTIQTRLSTNLRSVENSANTLSNITTQNNPEVSDLGSKDSVATSYGMKGIAKDFMLSFNLFFGWMFSGTAGVILITIFAGLFSMISLYFIIKWIRNGI